MSDDRCGEDHGPSRVCLVCVQLLLTDAALLELSGGDPA